MPLGLPLAEMEGALTPEDCRKVLEVWGALQWVAKHEVEHRVEEVFDHMAALCDGEDGFLLVVHRDGSLGEDDPLRGWRPLRLDNPASAPMRSAIAEAWADDPDNVVHDPGNQLIMSQAGQPRGYLFEDLMAAHGQLETPVHALIEALGLVDRLVVACPVTDALEFFVGLDRHQGSLPFTVRERNVLVVAVAGLRSLWTGFARSLGAIDASSTLTRRERDTLHGLLEGRSLQDIAQRLDISINTVRQYTRGIYAKFDVGNRAELAALWM